MNGILPAPIGNLSTSLSRFSASNCSIRIGNLRNLEILDLSKNQLTGFIPTTFQVGCTLQLERAPPQFVYFCGIQHLDLYKNQLTGFIPTTFSIGCGLESLNLNGNKLAGSLPQSLSNCRRLQVLDIGNNKIQDTFPVWTRNLTNLGFLILRSNNLSGTVPSLTYYTTLPFLPMLQVFDISHNAFIGNLPQVYVRNLKVVIDARENHQGEYELPFRFILPIPSIPFYAYSFTLTVKGSDLEYKRILIALTTIDMSSNRFSGSIPNSIGDLNSLSNMNLSHNYLTGEPLPPVMLQEEDGHDYGILEGFCWEAVVSGYGCGFVIGLIVGCLILGYGRPKWLVEWIYRFYRIKTRSRRRNVAPQRRR
ncbi:receptor-like protein 9DC3 [Salvia splendens]|uniref:receptor-like protein 9DC3 n=1 Tax=Salvia splendens TaxID=180675 RepID=UPI001C2666CB|nr:receptor-like protein 9DC3 [Salvia splendens]